jgi:hypothetical protein
VKFFLTHDIKTRSPQKKTTNGSQKVVTTSIKIRSGAKKEVCVLIEEGCRAKRIGDGEKKTIYRFKRNKKTFE